MSQTARIDATQTSVSRAGRSVDWPKTGNRLATGSEIFGQNVFTLKTLQSALPKPVYARFIQQIKVRCVVPV